MLLQWHDGFLPKYMPMIIPPIPWSGVYQGGYLTHSTCIMRARGSHRQIDLLKEADRTGQLNRVSACCCEAHLMCGLKLSHMAANTCLHPPNELLPVWPDPLVDRASIRTKVRRGACSLWLDQGCSA